LGFEIVPPGAQLAVVAGGSWRFSLVDSAFTSASFRGFKSPPPITIPFNILISGFRSPTFHFSLRPYYKRSDDDPDTGALG